MLIDAETGQLVSARDLPWYLRALEVSRPLHFGDYGGLPLKIIWTLLDLITIGVLGSGLYLWLAIATVLGLLAALLGQGLWHVLSWIALSIPIAVVAWYATRG